MKVLNIEKLTDEKFLNLYKINYTNGLSWTIASRRDPSLLMAKTSKCAVDTVTIIPIIKNQDGTEFVLLTKEFRYSLNTYVWSFPSGLVEQGENPQIAAKRELAEEVGVTKLESLKQISPVCLKSEGLTDESVVVYKAIFKVIGTQNLQDAEKIDVVYVPIAKIPQFIDRINKQHENISLVAAAYLSVLFSEKKS